MVCLTDSLGNRGISEAPLLQHALPAVDSLRIVGVRLRLLGRQYFDPEPNPVGWYSASMQNHLTSIDVYATLNS